MGRRMLTAADLAGAIPLDEESAASVPAPAPGRRQLTEADLVGATPLTDDGQDDTPAAQLAREKGLLTPGKQSKAETFVRGLGNTITFNHLDEISGWVDAALEGEFGGERYRQHRDAYRYAHKKGQEEQPGAHIAGVVGGVALTLGRGAAGAAPATVGQAAARGAVAGGASGLGASEAELAKGEFGQAILDTAVGAGAGAVAGAGGKKLADWFKNAPARADRTLMSDIGQRANKSVRDKMADLGGAVPRTARETGLDKVAQEAPELLTKATPLRKALGKQIGQAYQQADKHFQGAKVDDVTDAFNALLARYNTPADRAVRNAIRAEIKAVKEQWSRKGAAAYEETLRSRVGPMAKGQKVAEDAFRDRSGYIPLAQLNKYIGKLEAKGFQKADLTPGGAAQLKRDLAGAAEAALQRRFEEIRKTGANWGATAPNSRAFVEAAEAAKALDRLPKMNEQFRSLKLIETAAKQRERLTHYKPTGLRSFTIRGALESAADQTVGRVTRPLTERAAKLMRMAEAGDNRALALLETMYGVGQKAATREAGARAGAPILPRAVYAEDDPEPASTAVAAR